MIRNIPFVKPEEPLLRLYEEYHNEKIKENILELSKQYSKMQRVRGDGNCFYRAIIYEYLRFLSSGKFGQTVTNLFKKLNEFKEDFSKLESDFKVKVKTDFFIKTVENIERTVIEDLMVLQVGDSNDLVMFSRCCVACEQIRNKELLSAVIMKPFNNHIKQDVLRMGEEADETEIASFCNFFFGDAEFYLEINRMTREQINRNVYGDPKKTTKIAVLYRPGHYDILS